MYFGAKIVHFFVIQFIFKDYLEKWRIYIWKFGFVLIGNLAYNCFKLCNDTLLWHFHWEIPNLRLHSNY
ncbi:MAG TPA: hypothetical protein DEB74_12725 [Lachnospiraceae bacterium]|nr:hypothetical protein [Lachnospiraceae bacterium]